MRKIDQLLNLDSLTEGYIGQPFAPQSACPICAGAGKQVATAKNIHPDRPVNFSLLRCGACRHVWTDPLPTQGLLSHLYANGSNSVIGVGWEDHARAGLTIPETAAYSAERNGPAGRYLELGVGKGLLFESFQAIGWVCSGVEPGDWGQVHNGVVRTLDDVPTGAVFDVIVAIDVLEHVSDPLEMLKGLRSRMALDGRLYAAFPNNQSFRFFVQKGGWRMVRPLGHIHYFSRASAEQLFRRAGFQLTSARKHDLHTGTNWRRPKSIVADVIQRFGLGDQWLVVASPVEQAPQQRAL